MTWFCLWRKPGSHPKMEGKRHFSVIFLDYIGVGAHHFTGLPWCRCFFSMHYDFWLENYPRVLTYWTRIFESCYAIFFIQGKVVTWVFHWCLDATFGCMVCCVTLPLFGIVHGSKSWEKTPSNLNHWKHGLQRGGNFDERNVFDKRNVVVESMGCRGEKNLDKRKSGRVANDPW